MNKRVFLLLDYRDQFYFSTRYRGACVDIEKLKSYFHSNGYKLITKHFFEIDFRNENFKDEWILYQSSEDPDLFYKDYIEDILMALYLQGANLIPDFRYFRAHHNKVFMELLRDILPFPEIKNILSKGFGTYEEYTKSSFSASSDSFVLKPGLGTRSSGVKLLSNHKDKRKYPYNISKSFTFDNLKLFFSKLKTGKPFTPMSNNRRKFIVQNFISGLDGDFRVVIYGEKYYVVFRGNRDNDFRASGSGKLNFDAELPEGLLDYAKGVYTKFNLPFMSLDVGCKDGTFYLFEFQCLCLGQYTLEKSKFYYKKMNDGWGRVFEKPDLEREIVTTVLSYVIKK